jgi:hypothetical protein
MRLPRITRIKADMRAGVVDNTPKPAILRRTIKRQAADMKQGTTTPIKVADNTTRTPIMRVRPADGRRERAATVQVLAPAPDARRMATVATRELDVQVARAAAKQRAADVLQGAADVLQGADERRRALTTLLCGAVDRPTSAATDRFVP